MPRPTTILLATSNPHKVEEVRRTLAPAGVKIVALDDLGVDAAPPAEDQPTFTGNATRKARHYARIAHRPCLADDSGLEVDALDGAPGVRSARFAGVDGDRAEVDRANNRLLIDRLAGVPADDRAARFVCAMVLADADRLLAEARGTLEGRIIDQPRGRNGFGYDPHFWLADRQCTVAELPPEQKNAISHRGRAARLLLEKLRRLHPG